MRSKVLWVFCWCIRCKCILSDLSEREILCQKSLPCVSTPADFIFVFRTLPNCLACIIILNCYNRKRQIFRWELSLMIYEENCRYIRNHPTDVGRSYGILSPWEILSLRSFVNASSSRLLLKSYTVHPERRTVFLGKVPRRIRYRIPP